MRSGSSCWIRANAASSSSEVVAGEVLLRPAVVDAAVDQVFVEGLRVGARTRKAAVGESDVHGVGVVEGVAHRLGEGR